MKIIVYGEKPCDFSFRVQISACYLQLGDRFLFLKKAEGKLEPGTWGVPAGKIEKDESPAEGAIRELAEETGIRLDRTDQIQYLDALYIRKPDLDYVYHMFKIELAQKPAVNLSIEHQDYRWATADELANLSLMAGAKEAFDHFQILAKQ